MGPNPADELTRQLSRINDALNHWEQYEADRALPKELRVGVRRPGVPRQDLEDLRAIVMGELVGWEAGWETRN